MAMLLVGRGRMGQVQLSTGAVRKLLRSAEHPIDVALVHSPVNDEGVLLLLPLPLLNTAWFCLRGWWVRVG
jgi:hypothetical protein